MRKKIRKFIQNHWRKIAEIIVIIWAIIGMLSNYRVSRGILSPSDWIEGSSNYSYYLSPVLAYFLSAVLILYWLRKYERKN